MRYKILTLLLFVTSCNLSTHPTPTSTPANTLVPTVMVAQISTATDMPVPILEREKYTLNIIINCDLHFVTVDEKILYHNHTGQQLNSLTLAVAANLWQNCFKLATIKVDDIPIMDYTLTAQRLDITLLTPLEPDSILTVTLGYSLSLPYMDQAHSLRARIFGYSDVQMNLVNCILSLSHSRMAHGSSVNRGHMASIWFIQLQILK